MSKYFYLNVGCRATAFISKEQKWMADVRFISFLVRTENEK